MIIIRNLKNNFYNFIFNSLWDVNQNFDWEFFKSNWEEIEEITDLDWDWITDELLREILSNDKVTHLEKIIFKNHLKSLIRSTGKNEVRKLLKSIEISGLLEWHYIELGIKKPSKLDTKKTVKKSPKVEIKKPVENSDRIPEKKQDKNEAINEAINENINVTKWYESSYKLFKKYAKLKNKDPEKLLYEIQTNEMWINNYNANFWPSTVQHLYKKVFSKITDKKFLKENPIIEEKLNWIRKIERNLDKPKRFNRKSKINELTREINKIRIKLKNKNISNKDELKKLLPQLIKVRKKLRSMKWEKFDVYSSVKKDNIYKYVVDTKWSGKKIPWTNLDEWLDNPNDVKNHKANNAYVFKKGDNFVLYFYDQDNNLVLSCKVSPWDWSKAWYSYTKEWTFKLNTNTITSHISSSVKWFKLWSDWKIRWWWMLGTRHLFQNGRQKSNATHVSLWVSWKFESHSCIRMKTRDNEELNKYRNVTINISDTVPNNRK